MGRGRKADPPPVSQEGIGYVQVQEMILHHGWTHAKLSEVLDLDIRTIERLAEGERAGKHNKDRQRACFFVLYYQRKEALA